MRDSKENMLKSIESYLRDKSKDGLYHAFEYIGDSVSTQDLVMASEDPYYKNYLVNTILDEVKVWSDSKINKMVTDLDVLNRELPTKGDVWVGHDGWRVLITSVTNKEVTFFAGYDTITEEIELFINGYTKEL